MRVLIVASDPNAEGPLLGVVGERSTASRPLQPTAVAVGANEIYVADAGDRTIKVYTRDGTFERVIAKDLNQALTFVGGMVVLGNDLFVTDSNAGRVLVLDVRAGTLKRTFPDTRVLPRGICAGRDNGVLVADTFERSVLLLSAKGAALDEITAASGGSLGSPRDVAWSEAGAQAYVTDAGAGRVMVYRMRPSPE
jgi:DNA-binding beta-propeller fold protein YncE